MESKKIIEWKDEFSVGVELFDDQHKKIFEFINKFHQDIQSGFVEDKLKENLENFAAYADFHFKSEEEMFEKYDYPNKEEHIKAHNKYREKIAVFQKEVEGRDVAFAFEILDYIEDWIINHVIGMDKEYTEFFNQKGLK